MLKCIAFCYNCALYSTEAHPTESGDYIDYFLPVNKHQTIQDRLSAAGENTSLNKSNYLLQVIIL
jgi:hypothetical protein